MLPLPKLDYRKFEDHRGALSIIKNADGGGGEGVGFTQMLYSENPKAGTVRGLHCSP